MQPRGCRACVLLTFIQFAEWTAGRNSREGRSRTRTVKFPVSAAGIRNCPLTAVHLGSCYVPGRVRVVKLVLTAGTTHACNGGQPASVVGLRHSDAVTGLTNDG